MHDSPFPCEFLFIVECMFILINLCKKGACVVFTFTAIYVAHQKH